MIARDPDHPTRQQLDPAQPGWRQLNITFTATDRATLEHAATAGLNTTLAGAETRKLITSWFFIRKQPWKLRYLPTSKETTSLADELIHAAADALQHAGQITVWCRGVYEPETYAFGGDDGMAVAHTLAHADSRHIFDHLIRTADRATDVRDQRRELSILLCAALMTGAGMDRYERGDVWARIAALRPEPTVPADRQTSFTTAVERLISTDTSPQTALRHGALRHADGWFTSFERAGQGMRALADDGRLTRGLRSVTAHLIIFHWNRIGLPAQTQANLASSAKRISFDR